MILNFYCKVALQGDKFFFKQIQQIVTYTDKNKQKYTINKSNHVFNKSKESFFIKKFSKNFINVYIWKPSISLNALLFKTYKSIYISYPYFFYFKIKTRVFYT